MNCTYYAGKIAMDHGLSTMDLNSITIFLQLKSYHIKQYSINENIAFKPFITGDLKKSKGILHHKMV
jgi:hypothetical protein